MPDVPIRILGDDRLYCPADVGSLCFVEVRSEEPERLDGEDTVDNPSESEREVVGLVFALSEYLVHDFHESVPFMLLDSLEARDADRITTLVDYFADYADYLLVALLPKDAAALDDSSGSRISKRPEKVPSDCI